MAMRQRVLLLKDSPILATGIFLTIFDARNYETHNDEQKPHLKSYNLFKMVSERFEIQQQIPLGFLGGASGKEPACQSRRYKRCGTELQSQTWLSHWARMEQLPLKNDFVVLSASWSSDFTLFPGGSDRKESTCSVGDLGLIPVLGRSPGAGHGNPLLYSCLENPLGQRSLVGYNPRGYKESDMTNQLSVCAHTHTHTHLHQMINLCDVFVWRCLPCC